MSFAEPHFLLGLILIPVMGLFLAWAERQRRVRSQRWATAR